MEKENENKDLSTPPQETKNEPADNSESQEAADIPEPPQQSAEESNVDVNKDDNGKQAKDHSPEVIDDGGIKDEEKRVEGGDDGEESIKKTDSEPNTKDETSNQEKEENEVDPTIEGETTKEEETTNENVVDEMTKSEQVENKQIEETSGETIGEEKKNEAEDKSDEKEIINPTQDEILKDNVEQETIVADQVPTENSNDGDKNMIENNKTNTPETESLPALSKGDKADETKPLDNMDVGMLNDKEISKIDSSENPPSTSKDEEIDEINPSDNLAALSQKDEVDEIDELITGSNMEETTKTQTDSQDHQQHIGNESLENILRDATEVLGTDNGTSGQVEGEPELNSSETPDQNNNNSKKAGYLDENFSGKDFDMSDLTKDLPQSHSTEESILQLDDKEDDVVVDDLLNEENDDADILTNDLLTRELPQQNAPNVEAMAYESGNLSRGENVFVKFAFKM